MSEGMKGFKAEKKQHTAELRQQKDEAERKAKHASDFDAAGAAAADVYAPLFEKARADLRDGEPSESIASGVTRTGEPIDAMDANSGEKFAGKAFLKLAFHTGKAQYELVYLVSPKPLLGMLAWRRDMAAFHFVVLGSRMTPADLRDAPERAEQHFKSAVAAMLDG